MRPQLFRPNSLSVSPSCLHLASLGGQKYVRSLPADGFSEDEIYNIMKTAGYKKGRISQLLAATQASGSRDPRPKAEEGEESEEEGLPEDPDNYNVEAHALFEPGVEAEAGPAEESFQRHFASAVGIQARYVKNMHSVSVLVFASFPINPLPFQEPAPEDAAMEAAVTVTGLPRLRAKQRPHTGWEAVPIKASVLKMFEDLKKQPVKQTRKCQGNGDRPCVVGKKGKALFTSRGYRQCIWCSPSRLLEACRSGKASRGGLAKSFEAMTEHQQARAEALLPDEFKGYFVEL
eukprot:symbB.v1.2.034585.t1/scaffold4493.1/size40535/1